MTYECKDLGALAAISAALERLAMRSRAPYDGVLGEPPDWIPTTLAQDFRDARSRILDDGHPPERIRKWINAYRAPNHASNLWPEPYDSDVRTLARVEDMVRDGRELALEKLLGHQQFLDLRAQAVSDNARVGGSSPKKPRPGLALVGLMRLLNDDPGVTSSQLFSWLEDGPRTCVEGDADDIELRVEGTDIVVTNLVSGAQKRIKKQCQSEYLRRAKQQLAR